jgi:hypothetical protein
MWTVWILAYLAGLSTSSWYPAYSQGKGPGLSADQQISTGIMFFAAAVTFMPLIFWSLAAWLSPGQSGAGDGRMSRQMGRAPGPGTEGPFEVRSAQ